MGLVRITSWYPNFNGSHFVLQPSEIHRMTGLPPQIMWTMTYSHRPHQRLYSCFKKQNKWQSKIGFMVLFKTKRVCADFCQMKNWRRASSITGSLKDLELFSELCGLWALSCSLVMSTCHCPATVSSCMTAGISTSALTSVLLYDPAGFGSCWPLITWNEQKVERKQRSHFFISSKYWQSKTNSTQHCLQEACTHVQTSVAPRSMQRLYTWKVQNIVTIETLAHMRYPRNSPHAKTIHFETSSQSPLSSPSLGQATVAWKHSREQNLLNWLSPKKKTDKYVNNSVRILPANIFLE